MKQQHILTKDRQGPRRRLRLSRAPRRPTLSVAAAEQGHAAGPRAGAAMHNHTVDLWTPPCCAHPVRAVDVGILETKAIYSLIQKIVRDGWSRVAVRAPSGPRVDAAAIAGAVGHAPAGAPADQRGHPFGWTTTRSERESRELATAGEHAEHRRRSVGRDGSRMVSRGSSACSLTTPRAAARSPPDAPLPPGRSPGDARRAGCRRSAGGTQPPRRPCRVEREGAHQIEPRARARASTRRDRRRRRRRVGHRRRCGRGPVASCKSSASAARCPPPAMCTSLSPSAARVGEQLARYSRARARTAESALAAPSAAP